MINAEKNQDLEKSVTGSLVKYSEELDKKRAEQAGVSLETIKYWWKLFFYPADKVEPPKHQDDSL